MSALRLVELRSLRRVPHVPHVPRSPIRFLEKSSSRYEYSLRTWRRVGTPSTGALVLYRTQQSRYQSSSPDKRSARQNPPTPTPSLGEILRALRDGLSFRPLLSSFKGQSLSSLYRQSPEELVMALILCVFSLFQFLHFFMSPGTDIVCLSLSLLPPSPPLQSCLRRRCMCLCGICLLPLLPIRPVHSIPSRHRQVPSTSSLL